MDLGELGKNIEGLRKAKGLTQAELAKLLKVSDKTVSKWERGVSTPHISLVKNLLDILEVDSLDVPNIETDSMEEETTIENIPLSLPHKKRNTLLIILLGLCVIAIAFTVLYFTAFHLKMNLTMAEAIAIWGIGFCSIGISNILLVLK